MIWEEPSVAEQNVTLTGYNLLIAPGEEIVQQKWLRYYKDTPLRRMDRCSYSIRIRADLNISLFYRDCNVDNICIMFLIRNKIVS